MRVVVLGAGVVGVAAAYELLRDGHEVVVVERHGEAAEGTSFANAGLVAPGHAYAWASPTAPGILLRSLYRKNQAFRFKPQADLELYRWSLLFLRNCTSERARVNTLRKVRLCAYSQRRLHEVTRDTGVEYHGLTDGLLYLHRNERSLAAAVERMKILQEGGRRLEVLDAAGCVQLEPALEAARDSLAGGIYCPDDESGDARLFTRNLAAWCVQRGAEFRYATAVLGFELDGDRVAAVRTVNGPVTGDAYVLSLGCASSRAGRRLGLRLPIYPIKGYSVTCPIGPGHVAPSHGGVDEDHLVAFSRLGDRLRLTSTAEFAGYDTSHRPRDFEAMFRCARDLLPNAADYSQPSYWAGLRPMTPEGTPILGPSRQRNLWLNTGHGHMGWTMACGSARIVADTIAGRVPEIDLAGLTLDDR